MEMNEYLPVITIVRTTAIAVESAIRHLLKIIKKL